MKDKKGKGLITDSEDWKLVKRQFETGLWDSNANQIPHRRILDYNVGEKNWPADRYDYTSFSSSVRKLVNQLNLHRPQEAGKLSCHHCCHFCLPHLLLLDPT